MVLHEMADAMRCSTAGPLHAARFAEAMLKPDRAYATPSDVMLDFTLSGVEKTALLRNWKHELEQRSASRCEGMTDCEEGIGRAIAAVSSALERLEHR